MRRDGKIAELHHDPSIVEINVGGEIFLTTIQTLQREASVLTGAPRHDKEGRIFIDRDPTHFRWILNYLRDGYLVVIPATAQDRQELLQEARWYRIAGLVLFLEQQTQATPPEPPAKEAPTFLTARPCSKGIFYFPELKLADFGFANPKWDLLGVKFEDGKDDVCSILLPFVLMRKVGFFSISVDRTTAQLTEQPILICHSKLLVDRVAKTFLQINSSSAELAGTEYPAVEVSFWWEPSGTQYPQLYMRVSRGETHIFFQNGVDFLRTVPE